MERCRLAHIDEIAHVLTLEQGKLLWEARLEVVGAARCFEHYGYQVEIVEGHSSPLARYGFDFTVYDPFDAYAHIIS